LNDLLEDIAARKQDCNVDVIDPAPVQQRKSNQLIAESDQLVGAEVKKYKGVVD